MEDEPWTMTDVVIEVDPRKQGDRKRLDPESQPAKPPVPALPNPVWPEPGWDTPEP